MHLITGLRRAGAEGMLLKLLQHMDESRFASSVVVLSGDADLAGEIRRLGITVHVLGIGRHCGAISGGYRLLRLVRDERPAILQTWLYQADFAGLILSFLSPHLELIWNLRSTRIDSAYFPWWNRILPRLLAAMSRRPTAIVVNSKAGERDHMEMGYRPKRWVVLPNGFDLKQYKPDAEKRRMWRERFGLSGEPLIGMVARVNPMKNHAGFLRAAIDVAAARSDARFLLVGKDTDAIAFPKELTNRVYALGERSDVADILPALDLMVLPSVAAEGFPNVLGEAMACGAPCLATDIGDASIIIGDTGIVIPPGDDRALAAAMIGWFARDPETRARIGAAAVDRIASNYSIEAIVRRYEDLYENVAKAS